MSGISHGSEKISLQRNVLIFSGNIMYSALFLTVTIFFISIHANVPLVMLKNLCRTKVAFMIELIDVCIYIMEVTQL